MNRRPFFFSILAVISGILIGIILRKNLILLVSLASLAVIIPLFLRKSRLFFLFISVFFLFSSLFTAFSYQEYTETFFDCALSGNVTSIETREDSAVLLLEDAVLFTPESLELQSGVKVYLQNAGDIRHGNRIMVYGNLFPYARRAENPGETEGTLSALADHIGYGFHASSAEILEPSLNANHWLYLLKTSVRTKIDSAIPDPDCASILYAMISGDKSGLSSYTYSLFSSCGTSHLLAVSGLHVGILLTLLGAAVKVLRLPSGLKFILITIFILFYCFLTGFSPSIVRASFMAMLTLAAGIWGMRYDMLNALGFAGTVILLCNPFRLFDLSFQLSFAACFGIAVCNGLFHNAKHFPRLLASLSVTLGATIATLPIALYNFSSVPTISLLANLLLVPVASAALMLLVAALLLSFLWSGFTVLFNLPYWLMTAVLKISEMLSGAPVFTLLAFSAIVIPLCFLLLLLCSRFILLKPRVKAAGAGLLAAIILIVSLQGYMPQNYSAELRVLCLEKGQCVHIRCGGQDFIVGLNKDTLDTQMQYISKNIVQVKGVFLFSAQEVDALIHAIAAGFHPETVYLPQTLSTPDENVLFSCVKLSQEQNVLCGTAVFRLQGEGLQFLYNGANVYIHSPESKKIPDILFDIAVTENPSVHAETIISRKTEADFCDALYRTCYSGMVSCIIKEKIKIKTFHEVYP